MVSDLIHCAKLYTKFTLLLIFLLPSWAYLANRHYNSQSLKSTIFFIRVSHHTTFFDFMLGHHLWFFWFLSKTMETKFDNFLFAYWDCSEKPSMDIVKPYTILVRNKRNLLPARLSADNNHLVQWNLWKLTNSKPLWIDNCWDQSHLLSSTSKNL